MEKEFSSPKSREIDESGSYRSRSRSRSDSNKRKLNINALSSPQSNTIKTNINAFSSTTSYNPSEDLVIKGEWKTITTNSYYPQVTKWEKKHGIIRSVPSSIDTERFVGGSKHEDNPIKNQSTTKKEQEHNFPESKRQIENELDKNISINSSNSDSKDVTVYRGTKEKGKQEFKKGGILRGQRKIANKSYEDRMKELEKELETKKKKPVEKPCIFKSEIEDLVEKSKEFKSTNECESKGKSKSKSKSGSKSKSKSGNKGK